MHPKPCIGVSRKRSIRVLTTTATRHDDVVHLGHTLWGLVIGFHFVNKFYRFPEAFALGQDLAPCWWKQVARRSQSLVSPFFLIKSIRWIIDCGTNIQRISTNPIDIKIKHKKIFSFEVMKRAIDCSRRGRRCFFGTRIQGEIIRPVRLEQFLSYRCDGFGLRPYHR